jgi:HPt (histidine-containing phosphotransfer) domain-containing protein
MIELAETAEAWKLATHTLKGAAAAVGAKRLQDIAASLEALEPGMPADQKAVHLQALRAAAAEFRLEAGKIYP